MKRYKGLLLLMAALCLCLPALGEGTAPVYYLAGNFNGYSPNDPAFAMTPVEGTPGQYALAVELTKELRDPAYDGHWYKVTDGTWDNSWGTDNYALQPAPVKQTADGQAIGLGSVWVDADGPLTVIFDENTKTIYDTSMVREVSPRLYGDFNAAISRGADWGTSDEEAILLEDQGDGTFKGSVTLPAYAGDGEGYSFAVLLRMGYSAYLPWHGWGATEQYLFSGEPAGMGLVSHLKPESETTYTFVYDAATHVTTVAAQ